MHNIVSYCFVLVPCNVMTQNLFVIYLVMICKALVLYDERIVMCIGIVFKIITIVLVFVSMIH